MKKLVVAGFSLVAVLLLVLGSLTNVVGYQTIQVSQQKEINQKNLLFQTICDLANNKAIQKAILTSYQRFFTATKTLPFQIPTLTKRQLEYAYNIGLLLTRTIDRTKIATMTKQFSALNSKVQASINSIIQSNAQLSSEIQQVSLLDCPSCNVEKSTWKFPVICFITALFTVLGFFLFAISGYSFLLLEFIGLLLIVISFSIAIMFRCSWAYVSD